MKKISAISSTIALLVAAGISGNASATGLVGTAYSMGGNPDDNRVYVFGRFAGGAVRNFGSVSTGGGGFGINANFDPTGGQDSMVMSDDKRFLYVTNPGSGEISVFFLTGFGRPVLIQKVSSGGTFPTSIAIDDDVLYVINGGDDGALVPFHRANNGRLTMIEDRVINFNFGFDGIPRDFDRNFAPGDIAFDTVKRRLMMVYAGGGDPVPLDQFPALPDVPFETLPSGLIYTWELDNDGLASGEPTIREADGVLPFAIEFTENGWGLVAAAVSGSLASYDFTGNGAELASVSGAVPTNLFESCWIRVTSSRFGYVTNPFEGNISSFRIERDGSVTLNEMNASLTAGPVPTDLDIDDDEIYLYALVPSIGSIQSFHINHSNGSITSRDVEGGLPTFDADGFAPAGLVVR